MEQNTGFVYLNVLSGSRFPKCKQLNVVVFLLVLSFIGSLFLFFALHTADVGPPTI